MKINVKLVGSFSALCALVVVANPAYAYIDPGTGSMIVQAVIAAIAAVGVSIGVFRRQVGSFFGRLFGRQKQVGDDSDD